MPENNLLTYYQLASLNRCTSITANDGVSLVQPPMYASLLSAPSRERRDTCAPSLTNLLWLSPRLLSTLEQHELPYSSLQLSWCRIHFIRFSRIHRCGCIFLTEGGVVWCVLRSSRQASWEDTLLIPWGWLSRGLTNCQRLGNSESASGKCLLWWQDQEQSLQGSRFPMSVGPVLLKLLFWVLNVYHGPCPVFVLLKMQIWRRHCSQPRRAYNPGEGVRYIPKDVNTNHIAREVQTKYWVSEAQLNTHS